MPPPDSAASATMDIGVEKSLLIESAPEKCVGIALLVLLSGTRSLLCVPGHSGRDRMGKTPQNENRGGRRLRAAAFDDRTAFQWTEFVPVLFPELKRFD